MIRNRILISILLAAVWIGCVAAHSGKGKSETLTGSWGGEHIGITFTAQGASVEYDCAEGTIDSPVVPDREGHFEAMGTHAAEHGGPVREGEQAETRPARYRGRVTGGSLKLMVTLGSGEEVGTFLLTRDAQPRLTKCQ
ncbi:MAG: hypothetical protein QOF89_1204 [Acidobacteriota bacterium]|jgi:hypothetical protein|nr:hypothetical protein [Acidobacteriota bacterium]